MARHGILLLAVLVTLTVIGCSRTDPSPSDHAWAPAGAAMIVEVTGQDFEWHYRFAGADGLLDTADDFLARGDLHLPVGAHAELQLKSRDYIYTFAVPHFEVHEVAVPDLIFAVSIDATTEGSFELLGDQLCGYTHEGLVRRLVIESGPRFRDWMESTHV